MNWFRARYPSIVNILCVAAVLYLIWPLFGHTSEGPQILGRFSIRYFLFLSAWVGLLLALVVIAILGSRKANLAVLWSIILLACSLELYARARGLGGYYSSADALRYPAPYVGFVGRPGATVSGPSRMGGRAEDDVFRFNELGFRGPVPAEKPQGAYRVIVLGGSTVLNGAPLENSIPGIIESLYEAHGVQAEVFNWGVTSAVSGQELAILAHVASKFSPDLIIAYDGVNDMFVPFAFDPRPGVPYDWMVVETGLSLIRSGGTVSEWPLLLALRSKALTFLAQDLLTARLFRMQSLRNDADYLSPGWSKRIAGAWAQNMLAMCKVSRGLGSRFAGFLQPSVFTKEPLSGGEPAMKGTTEFQDHMIRSYSLFKAELEAISASLPPECSISDVSDALDGVQDQLFWDFVHVTNEGNRRVATAIMSHLMQSGHRPSS